ncbi:MAG: hypothetical protein AAF968_20030 [Pseudomonadota bacterium]
MACDPEQYSHPTDWVILAPLDDANMAWKAWLSMASGLIISFGAVIAASGDGAEGRGRRAWWLPSNTSAGALPLIISTAMFGVLSIARDDGRGPLC